MSKVKLTQKLLTFSLLFSVLICGDGLLNSVKSQDKNDINTQIEGVKTEVDNLAKNKPDLATLNKSDDEFTKKLNTLKSEYYDKLPPEQKKEIDNNKKFLILWLPLYQKTQTKEITEAQAELFGTADKIPTSEKDKFDKNTKETQTKYLEESPKIIRDLQLKLLDNQVKNLKAENSELANKKSLYETANLIQIILFSSLILLVIALLLLTIKIFLKFKYDSKKEQTITLNLSKEDNLISLDSAITVKPESIQELKNLDFFKAFEGLIQKYDTLIAKQIEKLDEKSPETTEIIETLRRILKDNKNLKLLPEIIKKLDIILEKNPKLLPEIPKHKSVEPELTKTDDLSSNITEETQEKTEIPSQDNNESIQNEQSISLQNNQRELLSVYNDNKLKETYKDLIAVSTEPNSIESSRAGSGKTSILTEQSPSKYWIVNIQGNLYLVPKEDALNTNDMTSVEVLFKCQDYNKDVSNPKVFTLLKAGQVSGGNGKWVLEEQGVLQY
ncbi:hypothetical protein [Aphanothece sacrum]|uniref:Uncharacterized protein n=1 Tax=Aphanothece sacrum FPU1 TaxID=1920663 RepID=A0A401IBZ9_APHSA|nr:hypothetical protein [Aphanothece sacrum]GBF78797.1 hypothetical protein AsFPU1_0187 [Aphanothece sacrum FPU1]GBF83029.1 hypothetical protein AsFPU3_0067 [Aphanothece sacrum FPU3]